MKKKNHEYQFSINQILVEKIKIKDLKKNQSQPIIVFETRGLGHEFWMSYVESKPKKITK